MTSCSSNSFFSGSESVERQVTGWRFSLSTRSFIPFLFGKSQLRSSRPAQIPYFSASVVKRVLVTTHPLCVLFSWPGWLLQFLFTSRNREWMYRGTLTLHRFSF